MASTIKLKNGSGEPLASDLVQGEPALDLTNKRLYTEDSGGTVIEVGTNPTELQVDNINIDGNAITSTDTDGDITITPNGTGTVVIDTDLDVDNININGNAITSTDTDGNIAITPNGTGEVDISKVDIDSGAIDNTVIGGTTTAAGSFTTLQADTSLNVDGTVTADGLTVDTDTLYVDATNNRVGIGTDSPSVPLEVNVSGTGDVFKLTRDTGTNGELNIDFSSANANFNSEQGGYNFETSAATNALVLSPTGNVGIGNTGNSLRKVDITQESGQDAGVRVNSDGSGAYYQMFTGTANVKIGSSNNTNQIEFILNAGSEAMRIDSSSNLDMTAGGGNIIMANGAGIDFGATANSPNGTMSNELLDDYEEGTWTPTLTFGGGSTGITYSEQFGRYTKIGNVVHLKLRIFLTNKGSSSGQAEILGMPFAPINDFSGVSFEKGGEFDVWDGFNTASNYRYVFRDNNKLELYKIDSNTTQSFADGAEDNDFTNGSDLRITITYHTS